MKITLERCPSAKQRQINPDIIPVTLQQNAGPVGYESLLDDQCCDSILAGFKVTGLTFPGLPCPTGMLASVLK